MNEIMISAENLTKRYGALTAVDNVSLTIAEGKICGLVGKNGAGKTTLIRLLTGLVKPTSGTFALCPERKRTDTTVAAIVERPSIYTGMTGMDNLRVQSRLLGIRPDEAYLRQTLELVGLNSFLQSKAKNYSLGMQQRLAVAMTLVGKPDLLILDEPTNGLDPQGIRDMRELFVHLNKTAGTTIVISSHILSELGKFATDYCIMDKGKVIKQITEAEIEAFGQKRLRIIVDDAVKAMNALSKDAGQMRRTGENVVEIYDDIAPTQVLLVLARAGVNVSGVTTVGEDLEDYYIHLVGGAQ